jgi:4-amino-4-deoxy-L-arabinose transferase-like glycosyltransferase
MAYFIKKNWKIIAFGAVVALAVFLRVWHFHDWLFFKMDQARDAFLTQQVFEKGIGWLPLLGPKAGGTHLNLGPVFYYFQYIAVALFHSVSPSTMAYPDLFFSILSIPLAYFLFKKYFDRNWSLILASAYALCFLAIEYSRFSWNPNALPFFNLLFFYSLLNVFDEKVKYRLRWAAVAGLSFAVSTQLHFLSFLTLPLITLIFLWFERKGIRKYLDWKKVALFLLMVMVLYAPVAANEIYTHGANSREFVAAIHSKASNHALWENISRDFIYFGQNWLVILTGYIGKNKYVLPAVLTWILFIFPALFLNLKFYRKEKDAVKKKFLLLTFCWFVVYFLAYIPIAYDTRPRFFLPMIILPFMFAGYISQYFLNLTKPKKIIWSGLAFAIPLVIILTNLLGTYQWFKEIKSSQKQGVYPKRTIILKARDGIVLWHLENAAKYIRQDCKEGRVYYFSTNEYKRPVEYLLGLQGAKAATLDSLYLGQKDCVYAVVLTRSAKGKLSSGITDKFDEGNFKKFGALTVIKLSAKDDFVGQPLGYTNKPLPEAPLESKRVYWKDVWKN